MRSARQHKVDLAVAQAYAAVGNYLLPDTVLAADVSRMIVPRATQTEIDSAIRFHDTEKKHLTSVEGATEFKRRLNEAGRAWLEENS